MEAAQPPVLRARVPATRGSIKEEGLGGLMDNRFSRLSHRKDQVDEAPWLEASYEKRDGGSAAASRVRWLTCQSALAIRVKVTASTGIDAKKIIEAQ